MANLPMVAPHVPHVAVDKALVFEAEAVEVEVVEEQPHEQVVTAQHFI